ncbi:MAG: MauE/DoxX family redox-associated membrane protein, partial [Pseudonocardiaceae bacterium]
IFFLVSGTAKLARPKSTSAALGVLRVPGRYRPVVTVLLAVCELVVGIALLLVDGPAVLILSAIMLVGFTVFLAYLASRSEATACGCLGDLGSANNSLGLIRNASLLGLLAQAASVPGAVTPGAVLGGLQVVLLLIALTEGLYVIGGLRTLRMASHG